VKKSIILFVLLLATVSFNVFAHDDVAIHPKIMEKSMSQSNLDSYLKNNLIFTKGTDTSLTMLSEDKEDTIVGWLKKGSTAEDHPMCRASNHFHDPLKSWDVSGRSDNSFWIGLINQYCNL